MQELRLGAVQGRSKAACGKRAWLSEHTGADEDTIVRWATGEELPPDPVIAWLADTMCFSPAFLMGWENAPRSEIPEQWRTPMAEDAAARSAEHLPRECEGLLRSIERRLRAEADLPDQSPDIPRLQRLRAAILEFIAEPLEVA